MASVTGNYQRLREHRFTPALVSAVRVTVTATNGDPSARIAGVRLFGDEV